MVGNGRVVDRVQVIGRDHGVRADVAKEGQLVAFFLRDVTLGAADEDIGGDADGLQLFDRVLGRFGFQLSRRIQVGQEGEMHVDALAGRVVEFELADGFEEGQALDIADGSADFTEHEIDLVLADADKVFDLVGDMGDDLNCFAKVIAAPLFFEDV